MQNGQHEVDVPVAVVVAVDRCALAGSAGQVLLAGAEVDRRPERRVVDVLRVALAVAIAVHADDRPGGGDELHGADRPVVLRVVVVLAGVGVGDPGGVVGAVERDAVDAWAADAVAVEDVAPVAAVVGLHPTDRGDEGPVEVARRVRGVDDLGGALVGRQRGRRDAVGRGDGDHAASGARKDTRGDLTGPGHARRCLDGLVLSGGAVRELAGQLLRVPRAGPAGHRVRRPGGGQQGQGHQRRGLLPASHACRCRHARSRSPSPRAMSRAPRAMSRARDHPFEPPVNRSTRCRARRLRTGSQPAHAVVTCRSASVSPRVVQGVALLTSRPTGPVRGPGRGRGRMSA